MKKTILNLAVLFFLTVVSIAVFAGRSYSEDTPLDMIVLFPGDSRSISFEYNGTVTQYGSYHMALVTAVSTDNEIHQLTINITPMGDLGTEVSYFTWGAFINFSRGVFNSFEILKAKYTFAHENVTYVVNINPLFSTGFIFSSAIFNYSYFDFPLDMSMTLTLSN